MRRGLWAWIRRQVAFLSANSPTTATTTTRTPPSWTQKTRQVLGRALRETGQALDRSALRLETFGHFPGKYVGQDPPTICQDFLSRHRQQLPLLHCGKPAVSQEAAFVAPCATLLGSVRVYPGASIWYGAVLRADTVFNAASFDQTDAELLEQGTDHLLLTDGTNSNKKEKDDEEDEVGDDKQDDEDEAVKRLPPMFAPKPDSLYEVGGEIHIGPDSNVQDAVVITARQGHTLVGRGVTIGHLAQLHSCRVDDFSLIGMGAVVSEGCHIASESLIAAGALLPAGTHVKEGELWVGQPARKIRDLTEAERERLHYQSSEYVKVALTHKPVQALGGGLPPDVSLDEALLAQARPSETTDEWLLRKNKWRHTVYKSYVPHPDDEEDKTYNDLLEAEETRRVAQGWQQPAVAATAAANVRNGEHTALPLQAEQKATADQVDKTSTDQEEPQQQEETVEAPQIEILQQKQQQQKQ